MLHRSLCIVPYQPIRIQGQQYDEESGLHYNRYRYRYYDPGTGRYISQDPIGLNGGWNAYQYPLNPVMDIDPLGLFVPLVIAGYYLSAEAVAWISAGLFASAVLSTPAVQQAMKDTANTVSDSLTQCDTAKQCPPCKTVSGKIVAMGTIGYRHDLVPPSAPHYPLTGDHYNLYKSGQNPKNCQCFWTDTKKVADASGGLPPPVGSIPIEPFVLY